MRIALGGSSRYDPGMVDLRTTVAVFLLAFVAGGGFLIATSCPAS